MLTTHEDYVCNFPVCGRGAKEIGCMKSWNIKETNMHRSTQLEEDIYLV